MSLTLDTPLKLDVPFLEDGIRSTHFFNGRLLSGEDLSQEQQARDGGLQQLGRALGEGIASGLRVTAPIGGSTRTDPIVTVEPGVSINRLGQVLELRRQIRVNLREGAVEGPLPAPVGPGGFKACERPAAGIHVAGTGVYLLVIAPAEGREGTAVVSGLGSIDAPCNARRRVEGVRFRLLRLDIRDADLADTARLRNRVAHHCFGTTDPKVLGALVHPFGVPPESYGLLDAHRPLRLTACDVPLAVIHWEDGFGFRFVDLHSVRRRPTRMLDTGRWWALVGDRRDSEAEARFLQFQEQIDQLVQDTPETVRALDHFEYLPPAGVLPLRHKASRGFDSARFFQGLTVRGPMFIEGARLEPLLRQARSSPSIVLERPEHELIWLYLVRENVPPSPAPGQEPQPYLVFASGHLAYQGDARFDVARWDFAHHALDVPAPGARTGG
ncbi:hypothetical protein [Corallococcus exiguus]|uniref:Uncharacterized protein n=1 Tax=Corallococcus exiguus TaxID=83462 RepID=A0A7X4YIH9_9BACT|nr:hypothetical protein [Corallococcus exiguus]NBC45349.1 hypothetical protein [Corallococcus exiguus]TNV53198.1 hypothetical protein FH620_36400 [Corallococcus exiguus]